MGKKGKGQKVKVFDCGLSKLALQNMLSEILQKCVNTPGVSSSEKELLASHLDLRKTFERLATMQKVSQISSSCSRKVKIEVFTEWLKMKGVDMSKCEVFSVPDLEDELGIRAVQDIEESAIFLEIPRSVMIYSEVVEQSSVFKLLGKDPMLSGMPNVALAMFLVSELYNSNSEWRPYIDVLPTVSRNVLFFSYEDFLLLRGSPSLREGLNLWKSIVRQYCYLYLLLLKQSDAFIVKIAHSFAFEDYRWAVSVVMTRENLIPANGIKPTGSIALIPLLDMCNHCNTKQSIDFDDSSQACVCYAPTSLKAGEEIRIFYGPRPNVHLVLHNGFYFPSNPYDIYNIKLSLGKADPERALRTRVLTSFGLLESSEFLIRKLPNPPIGDSLALFGQVFCSTRGELEQVQLEQKDKNDTSVDQIGSLFSEETKAKAQDFLRNRLLILLKSYTDSIDTDDELLQSGSLSRIARNIVQLRRSEKVILQNAASFLQPN